MDKKDNVESINPTLNGGKRGPKLICGCDPDNAELDEKGTRVMSIG